ncbi:MAG: putative permease [Bacteriovoracaceae bacterium]|jgi:putative permease
MGFFIVSVIAILAIFFNLPRVMIPFGIAYIISLMLRPVQKSLFSVDIRKKSMSIIMVFGFLFIFSYPVIEAIKTIGEESHRIEYYLPKLENYLRTKYVYVQTEVKQRFNYDIETNPVDKLIEFGQENTKQLFVFLPQIIGSLLEWGLMIPLFLFFILKDERKLRFQFIQIVPNNIVERAYYLYHQFNTKFGDYIFAKAIEAAIVGTIITTGLLIIGYPFAFLLGILAGITNILPYIGPILGFVPALVVGLVDQNPNTTLGAMFVLYLVANIIDLAFVFPLLVSKIVNLHPIIVVISVILGSQFGGVVGMIISIPMAAFIKLLFQEIYLELYGKA